MIDPSCTKTKRFFGVNKFKERNEFTAENIHFVNHVDKVV
jgi:hypothetical protein